MPLVRSLSFDILLMTPNRAVNRRAARGASVLNGWFGILLRGQFHHAQMFAPLLGVPEVVLRLLVQPAFCRGSKRDR